MSNTRICFDEQAFIRDCVCDCPTQEELAQRYGLSPSLVAKIILGQRRPHIAKSIATLTSKVRQKAHQDLQRLAKTAVETLARTMKTGAPRDALMAANAVLKSTIGEDLRRKREWG